MASKKIRKKGEPRLGESPKVKPAVKSSKKGCFFWVLVFLVLSAGGFYKWDLVQSYVPQLDQLGAKVQGLWGESSSDDEPQEESLTGEPQDTGSFAVEPLMPPQVKRSKPVRKQRNQNLQYVRVGNCLSVECRVQLVGEVESLGLPSMVKPVKKRTLYYELVSKSLYTRTVGESKVLDIERHALSAAPAALRASGKRWQISLGEFPERRQAVYMKSYLAQLYPDVDIAMVLKPRRRSLAVEYIYSGPFTSKFNAEQVVELLRNRRFIQETVVTTLP